MFELGELKGIYEQQFIPARDARWTQWLADYEVYVTRVQRASEDEWMHPEFQQFLWEDDGVSTAGLGATVVVKGAYTDRELAQALFNLRRLALEQAPSARAQQLQTAYDQIMGRVSPRHNEKRPGARLIRIFAGLFPQDVLCLLDSHRTQVVRRALGMKKGGLGTIAQQVLVRQKLREALGEPKDLKVAVEQSMFSWFLFELAERGGAAADGDNLKDGAVAGADASPGPQVPKLKLLPLNEQRRGIFHVPKALAMIMRVLRAVENGGTREDLFEAVREHSPNLKGSSVGMYLSLVRSTLGLLEFRDNTFWPSARGRLLLDGEDPSDVLAPVLLARVFGFAQIVWRLKDSRAGLTQSELVEYLRAVNPHWKSGMTASAIPSWAREIGLLEQVVDLEKRVRFQLTEAGVYWASTLPDDLESRWSFKPTIEVIDLIAALEAEAGVEAEADSPSGVSAHPDVRLKEPPFGEIHRRLVENPELKQLVFTPEFLRLFDAALRANSRKRFVLLAGLSGTGKTSLARAYARAYCDALGLRSSAHYLEVAVRPDWTDPTGLLGYYNPFPTDGRYEETAALRHLLIAAGNPDKPYFLCLDEMNLARVEHYFAPFLSAMEGQGELQIHNEREEIDGVKPRIPWPRNLFIIGTVNMDETTHDFSDKVLDRAFPFVMWDVDLAAWHARQREAGEPAELLERVHGLLDRLYRALYPARRHFGYRTCDEVLAFCRVVEGLELAQVLDAAVLAKVLPKLRGDDSGPLPEALAHVEQICRQEGLKGSEEKVRQMAAAMKSTGMARFWR